LLKYLKKSLSGEIIILVLCLLVNFAVTQTDFYSKIDNLVSLKKPSVLNGVVLIIQNGKTLYPKASGLTKSKNNESLKTNIKFVLLSNSKQTTAVIIV
jgi:hypothetical protein